MDSSPAVPWGNSASFVVWLPNHQGQPVTSFIPSNASKTGIRIPEVKGERNRESPSRRFLAGKRILISLALLLFAAGVTTSSAGCLDDAGDFVWGLCAPMFAAGVDGDGDLYVHGQLHESADVGSLAGASSNVLWSLKNSGGTTVLALYRNDTTHRYDLAITGALVTEANFGDYSAVGDYWSLKEDTSYLVALKEAGGGLTDGSLLVAGQALDEATFQCDLEFVKNFTSNYWVKMDRWGHLSKSTDGENYTTLHDFYTDLEQNDAYPVDLELETVVSSTCSVQVRAATAYVMDNKANLYVYDILSSATDIRSVTNAFLDVVDFEIGPSGVDNELYLLRLAGGGTIVNVTGSEFESNEPWKDDNAAALNIELVVNATGETSGIYVLSDRNISGSTGMVYRVGISSASEFGVPVVMGDEDILAFAASPRDNILMLFHDDNADGTGEMYYFNRKDAARGEIPSASFVPCSTETLGFTGVATQERFAELGYYVENYNVPAAATAETFNGTIELVYHAKVPMDYNKAGDNSDVRVDTLILMCTAISNATPSGSGVEHCALFTFNSAAEAIEYATEVANLVENSAYVIRYYWAAWGPDWYNSNAYRFHNGAAPDENLLGILAGHSHCKGFYFSEIYNSGKLIDWQGNYRVSGEYDAKEYLDAVVEAATGDSLKILWHEAGNTGPGGGEGHWEESRVGWWGFALYDTVKYLDLFNNPATKDVFVQMHEDIQFTADTANLGTVFGTWLASENRSRWGASLQGFWWMHTQCGQGADTQSFPLRIHEEDAQMQLQVQDATDNSYYWEPYHYLELYAFPGYNPDEANWAEIPPDLTSRQLLQYLNLGATVFEFEHSPYVFCDQPDSATAAFDDNFFGWDDGSGGKAGGINPVMGLVADGTLKVPTKNSIRHLSGLNLYLNDTDTATDVAKLWANAEHGSIGDSGDISSFKFGIFIPDYHVPGYNDEGEDVRFDPVMPSDATSTNYRGWIHPSYAARFELASSHKDIAGDAWLFPREDFSNDAYETDGDFRPTLDLAQSWIEAGTSNGVVKSSTGHSDTCGLRDYMAQKVIADGTMTEDYAMYARIQFTIPYAHYPSNHTCKVVLSASASGIDDTTVEFGYATGNYSSTPPSSPSNCWTAITNLASGTWYEFESDPFTYAMDPWRQEITLWMKIWQSSDVHLALLVDDLILMATDSTHWYPITATIRRMRDRNSSADFGIKAPGNPIYYDDQGRAKFNPYYRGDFLVPEIVKHGTEEWAYGDYYIRSATDGTCTGDWRDWLKQYGIYSDPSNVNLSSATAYSCAGEYFDINRHYFAVNTENYGAEPFTKDDPNTAADSFMPLSTIPLPQPVILGATTPNGLNRYLYKYAAFQKRHWDSLLADSRYGFIPLVPEALEGRLPSRCKDTSTNGMDVRVDATFDGGTAALEPIEFGSILSFMEDAQLVSVVCSATDTDGNPVDREVNVAVSAIASTEVQDNGKTLHDIEYQLVLFDAAEGGIEIAPASRELSTASNADNILTATVTVNCGAVGEFKEWNVAEPTNDVTTGPLNTKQEFVAQFPRYSYDVITFKTRRLH